ncbi:MAG: pyridoxal phosphate-dependent aminotransferase [Streptococcaceae bacterium]|nr:pyridoxal phosphate-dependent aminotransferase [Streptococcaceae bacterium]
MKKLSNFVSSIAESATLASAKRAKDLTAAGRDIIDLTLGQPDFVTPEPIDAAAIASIKTGKASFYTQAGGLPELKKAAAAYWERFYGYEPKASEILVTSGAKFALYAYFLSVLDPGDEVIIPAPYWVSYFDQVKMAEGIPVTVETRLEDHFKITVEQLQEVKSDKTKVLLINSPSNPTGMVYSKEELLAIGQWAIDNDVLILSDDIYHRLVYGKSEFVAISSLSDELRARTMVINGVSKTFSMTGWRIGLAVGDAEIISAMTKIASQTTSNPTAVSQYASIEAFSDSTDSYVETMRSEFEKRLETIMPALENVPGFEVVKPDGAFYLFPKVAEAMRMTGYDSIDDFSSAILEEAGVAIVSGTGFGSGDHIRMSYATDLDSLMTGVKRLKEWIEKRSI